MDTNNSSLRDAFLEDHRLLTRGFNDLLKAIDRGDAGDAARIAEELDRDGGAHIEFEERILYPQVQRILGQEFADRLYREHRVARSALQQLLEQGERAGAQQLAALRQDVKLALDHAVTCGTLVSYMTTLPAERQAEMLAQLHQIRKRRHRWSELPEKLRPDASLEPKR